MNALLYLVPHLSPLSMTRPVCIARNGKDRRFEAKRDFKGPLWTDRAAIHGSTCWNHHRPTIFIPLDLGGWDQNDAFLR